MTKPIKNTIFWSHGDIGGVGKSTTTNLLIDILIGQNRPILLIEGARRDGAGRRDAAGARLG